MNNQTERIIDINELPKIKNGKLWYIAFLPLLACYLESYAVNIYMGLLLWGSILIICPLVCISDENQLRKFGINNYQLHKYRFVPPLYVFNRLRITGQSNTPFVLFIVFTVYALVNNGFVNALRATDETFIEAVKSSYVSSLTGESEYNSYDIIGNRINDYAEDNKTNWSFSEDRDYKYVIAEFKGRYNNKDSQDIKFIFKLDFDGYCLKETKVGKVYVNGNKLKEKERDDLLNQILILSKENEFSSKKEQEAEYKSA